MNLNYLAFFLISFLPLLIAYFWYRPQSRIVQWAGIQTKRQWSALQWIVLFLLSFSIVYGYMNLIIHQLGFYELFFTDIMMGKEGAQEIVDEFLGQYGNKHRHFGHGVFHGIIIAFVFGVPFIGIHAIIEQKSWRYFWCNWGYWLFTSLIIGGLISAFV